MFPSSTRTTPASPVHPLPETPAPGARAGRTFRRSRRVIPMLTMGLVVPGMVAAIGIPAYAFPAASMEVAVAKAQETAFEEASQSVELLVAADIEVEERDEYKTTSAAELERRRLERAGIHGPGNPLTNPPAAPYDQGAVVDIAYRYLGVPYQFAGSSPSGFDCSGLTMYVFAQVGISLPHSSSAQGAMTSIAASAAKPGDIVVLDGGGHVGIYLGGNQMIHAPYPGTKVRVGTLWGSYWFVRPGI